MRQLATIRTVNELVPIAGADRIELARIDGWQCVVKKGEFAVGSTGLYLEIDSLAPTKDERFAFLAKGKIQDFARVKTVRLRGALSQGLLLPLSVLTTSEMEFACARAVDDTRTLADILGVKLYEPAVPVGGKQKGTFPLHLVPKTDQERIQNVPHVLKDRKITDFEVTEKLDGTSCTIWFYLPQGLSLDGVRNEDADTLKDIVIGVASRNWEMQKHDENVYSKVLRDNNLVVKLSKLQRNIAIQGEIIGPNIQDNKYGLARQEFYVFDIYDIDVKKYLPAMERMELTVQLGLQHVPTLVWNEHTAMTLENILAMADGTSALCRDNVMREGAVFKALDGSFSFKAISNEWLLKYE